ncbi:MAG: MBL fold metallo-hydrolase [Halanaerobiales bacterium]|nr:MBL fold metallo-hydrolase [Halanaerobiales bacterium]
MEKIQLTDNFFLYQFDDTNEINIVVLTHNNKALLFDTGYPEIAKEVLNHLKKEDLQPEIIINTHYHPDHINGNFVFKECKFMGSEYYKQNFELFEALNPTTEFVKPTTLIKDGDIFHFGSFELKFFYTPGHCRDCLITVINDEITHVADLLMLTNSGKHTLPYISYDGNIDEHIKSLELLKSLKFKTLLPSHGKLLKASETISHAIHLRTYYLEQLKDLGKLAKVENCLCDHSDIYDRLEFHKTNIENVFGRI